MLDSALAGFHQAEPEKPCHSRRGPYTDVSLSPDGHRALAGVLEDGRYLIRVLDFDRKTDDALDWTATVGRRLEPG